LAVICNMHVVSEVDSTFIFGSEQRSQLAPLNLKSVSRHYCENHSPRDGNRENFRNVVHININSSSDNVKHIDMDLVLGASTVFTLAF
jgi:hypothetical protein